MADDTQQAEVKANVLCPECGAVMAYTGYRDAVTRLVTCHSLGCSYRGKVFVVGILAVSIAPLVPEKA